MIELKKNKSLIRKKFSLFVLYNLKIIINEFYFLKKYNSGERKNFKIRISSNVQKVNILVL